MAPVVLLTTGQQRHAKWQAAVGYIPPSPSAAYCHTVARQAPIIIYPGSIMAPVHHEGIFIDYSLLLHLYGVASSVPVDIPRSEFFSK